MENYSTHVVTDVPRTLDHLIADEGSAYNSTEMKGIVEVFETCLDEALVETPGAIGVVNGYHAPLQVAYERVREDTNHQTSDQDCLQMEVFGVYCSIGPEGLCPAQLVIETFPRPAQTLPTPSQLGWKREIDCAMEAIVKGQTRKRIAYGLKHMRRPKGPEHYAELRYIPLGCSVLVYRTKSKKSESLIKFTRITRENVVVQMNLGQWQFRSTCVKLAVKGSAQRNIEPPNDTFHSSSQAHTADTSKKHSKDIQEATAHKSPRGGIENKFVNARMNEIRGLIENGIFKIRETACVEEDTLIYGT